MSIILFHGLKDWLFLWMKLLSFSVIPLNVNAESKDMATLWPLTETVAANGTVPILKV